MESLANDISVSSNKHINSCKRKTHQTHQFHHHHVHPSTRLSNILRQSSYQETRLPRQSSYQDARLANILRQSSCNIMYQKYPPSPSNHVQLEMAHAFNQGAVFLNQFPNTNNKFCVTSSLPPILPSFQPYHQPPLLPLPAASKPTFQSLPTLARRSSLSSPSLKKQPNKKTPQNKKKETNNNNNKNINNKNINNNNNKNNKKQLVAENPKPNTTKGSILVENKHEENGSDPGNEPNEVTGVISRPVDPKIEAVLEMEKFTTPPVFCLSPPPSSLPLPKFCSSRKLQQKTKLSCKAEAAVDEIDAGVASDKLCQLLKLR
ncbi:unnamed protein product [Amaranthus hypochondriacus]